ncbi:MAG: ABC transporter substrate-binding protein [Desulfovibrio sp.]
MSNAFAVEIIDDRGVEVRLEQPATRVVALYGAFNEMLLELGAEDTIIARTRADVFPASILEKPVIGTHMRPNVELVLGLKPDLVLQMGGRKKALAPVEQLEAQGIPVAAFTVQNFDELFSVIERIGILVGKVEEASSLEQSMKKRLDIVSNASVGLEKSSVFFEVRYPNLLAAGQESFVTDVIARAGGINCVSAQKKFVRLSEEVLLMNLNPQVYILQRGVMNRSTIPVRDRPAYRVLQAVQNARVYEVDEQLFSRPGPRSVDAVEQLFQLLHVEKNNN